MSDWKARAEREAAAIIAEAWSDAYLGNRADIPYETLVSLIGIGWLQGANYGSHETLRLTEDAFDELKASL